MITPRASMDGSKPAICGRLKTGHFQPETGVEIYFTASSFGKVFAGALAVTPEAPGQLDSLQYRQIQLADLLEQLRGRGPGQRFRQRVPPLPVLFLQLQERLHRIVPLLWPRSAVRWPTVPDPGFAGLAPLPITCLPLRVRQCHTAIPRRYVTGAGEAVSRAIEAQVVYACALVRNSVREVVLRAYGWPLWFGPGWVPSRTSVLVMPGRGTLARRNGRLGRTVWSTTTNRSGRSVERPLGAAEGSSGARGDGGVVRQRWLRQARLEAAPSRARTTSGWALTLAARESSAPQGGATGGKLRTPSDAGAMSDRLPTVTRLPSTLPGWSAPGCANCAART